MKNALANSLIYTLLEERKVGRSLDIVTDSFTPYFLVVLLGLKAAFSRTQTD